MGLAVGGMYVVDLKICLRFMTIEDPTHISGGENLL
jgi:hypothetical protein